VLAATRSLEAGSSFPKHEKARQARSGNRGHVLAATHSLEAGGRFPKHEKARQARSGNRGHVSAATRSLEAGVSVKPTRTSLVAKFNPQGFMQILR